MKRSIIILLLALGTTLAIGVASYLLFLSPQAQAERIANRVMQSAQEQDEAAFRRFSAPSNPLFLAAHQRNYRLDSLVKEKTTFFIRYTFTDTQNPSRARITVRNGEVIKIVTGDTLGKTPRDDPRSVADTNTSQSFCLQEEDLGPLDTTRFYARTIRGATMIFGNETAIDYVDTTQSSTLLERMAKFYTSARDKDFSFLVRGYLPTISEQHELQQQIVDNRTTKIQQDLVDRGVPRDRIHIGQPVAYDGSLAGETDNNRYVIIDVINNCID